MANSVLILGAGAIGAFYGGVLARAGCEVSVVARSDHDVVARDGYRIESTIGDLSFKPRKVLRAAEPGFDIVFVALKLTRGIDRVSMIRPALGPKTVIVLVVNGIDVEQEIADAFPQNELLSGVAYAGASREGPGYIRHHSQYTRLILGRYPAGTSETAGQISELLKQGGSSCQVTEDIAGARWMKCAWNTVFNPISAIGGGLGSKDMLATEESVAFAHAAISEVCAIAKAAGHPLPDDTADKQIAGTQRMANHVSSMGQDWLAGRPMETEALLGNAVRIARRLGVAAPRLESLYALLLMAESRRRGPAAIA